MADLNLWTKDSKLSNFADDTQSCVIKPTEEELRATTVQESQAVVGYFSANNLVNNKEKAALLYNNRRRAETITMEIAGEEITAKNSEKLLGIHVSSNMDWKTHIGKLQIQVCFYNFGLITIHGLKTQKNCEGVHKIQDQRIGLL